MVSRPIKVNYVTILYCVPSVLDEICRECNELFWLDCPHIFTFKRVCFLAMIRAFRIIQTFLVFSAHFGISDRQTHDFKMRRVEGVPRSS